MLRRGLGSAAPTQVTGMEMSSRGMAMVTATAMSSEMVTVTPLAEMVMVTSLAEMEMVIPEGAMARGVKLSPQVEAHHQASAALMRVVQMPVARIRERAVRRQMAAPRRVVPPRVEMRAPAATRAAVALWAPAGQLSATSS